MEGKRVKESQVIMAHEMLRRRIPIPSGRFTAGVIMKYIDTAAGSDRHKARPGKRGHGVHRPAGIS